MLVISASLLSANERREEVMAFVRTDFFEGALVGAVTRLNILHSWSYLVNAGKKSQWHFFFNPFGDRYCYIGETC